MPARCLAIVPAYNEEASVARVVAEIRAASPEIDVLVVSDGSADRTADVARSAGATVLQLPVNLGIGGAMQTGYLYAARQGYALAVQVDGDGQHDPAELPPLLAAVQSGTADLAVGSRYLADLGYRGPWLRRFGGWLLGRLVQTLMGQPISDPTSGFRVSNARAIGLFARHYPVDYPEVEALVLLRRRGLTVREFPVRMRARQGGRSSITPLKSVDYMAKVALATLLQGWRPGVGRR